MSTATRSTMQCPSCGAADTMTISLTLAGTPATFRMCSMCEWKGWERAGEDLRLESVLALVATR